MRFTMSSEYAGGGNEANYSSRLEIQRLALAAVQKGRKQLRVTLAGFLSPVPKPQQAV
jgi:hypothetical protein